MISHSQFISAKSRHTDDNITENLNDVIKISVYISQHLKQDSKASSEHCQNDDYTVKNFWTYSEKIQLHNEVSEWSIESVWMSCWSVMWRQT